MCLLYNVMRMLLARIERGRDTAFLLPLASGGWSRGSVSLHSAFLLLSFLGFRGFWLEFASLRCSSSLLRVEEKK